MRRELQFCEELKPLAIGPFCNRMLDNQAGNAPCLGDVRGFSGADVADGALHVRIRCCIDASDIVSESFPDK